MGIENTPNAVPTVTTGHEEEASSVSLQGQEFRSNDVGPSSITVDPTEAEIDADLGAQEAEDGDENLEGDGAEPSTDDVQKTDDDAGADEEQGDAADLPDYNADDEAVIAKYDEKYLKQDEKGNSVLNLDAFNDELNANYAEGKLDINPGSRQFVKDTFGVDDKAIDLYLAGLKVEADAKDNERYALVGGKDIWDSLVEWGKTNYTPEQQKRFNEAVQKGGDEAAEQVELLKARAAGKVKGVASKGPGRLGRRPSSPAKVVDGSRAAAPKAEPFATSEDHRKAMVEAEKSGDMAKVEEVRKRLRASAWFKG